MHMDYRLREGEGLTGRLWRKRWWVWRTQSCLHLLVAKRSFIITKAPSQFLTYTSALFLFTSFNIYNTFASNRISLLKVLFMQFYFSCKNKKYNRKGKKRKLHGGSLLFPDTFQNDSIEVTCTLQWNFFIWDWWSRVLGQYALKSVELGWERIRPLNLLEFIVSDTVLPGRGREFSNLMMEYL